METKLHGKDELMLQLVNRVKEELVDVETYNGLYEMFMAQGLYEEAVEIEHIARDEFSHAEILCDILEEDDHLPSMDPDIKRLWQRAKEIFHVE